jgi:hypothetical protein
MCGWRGFDGWDRPTVLQKDSGALFTDFEALRAAREEADGKIRDWASRVTP